MKTETLLAQVGCRRDERYGAVTVPIYQTATFSHPALGQSTGFDYSRSGNPTRQALEDALAMLEGGSKGLAFSSGMAAIDCVLRLFEPGDKIIITEDLYGGTFRLFEKVFKKYNIEAVYVDTTNLSEVESAYNNTVKAVFIEVPTNPLLKIADIKALSEFCKKHQLLFIVDNTFLTFYFLKPLALGADIVVYSATKYLAGHNDVVAGAVIARDANIAEQLYFYQNSVGSILGPLDAWLVLRGLKTLALRIRRQEESAKQIATWVKQQRSVRKVFYPGLEEHPGHELIKTQSNGYGGMIAFEVDDVNLIDQILARVKVFHFAESLGGVESLITYPIAQTHADIDEQIRSRVGINKYLLRLSIGIEDSQDLIDDLKQALER